MNVFLLAKRMCVCTLVLSGSCLTKETRKTGILSLPCCFHYCGPSFQILFEILSYSYTFVFFLAFVHVRMYANVCVCALRHSFTKRDSLQI